MLLWTRQTVLTFSTVKRVFVQNMGNVKFRAVFWHRLLATAQLLKGLAVASRNRTQSPEGATALTQKNFTALIKTISLF